MSDPYIYVNTDPNSPRYRQHYEVHGKTGGEWHIYPDAQEWVVGGNVSHDVLAAGWSPPPPPAPQVLNESTPNSIAGIPNGPPPPKVLNESTPNSIAGIPNGPPPPKVLNESTPNSIAGIPNGPAPPQVLNESTPNSIAGIPNGPSATGAPAIASQHQQHATGGIAAPANGGSGATYTVVHGDTLSGIAAANGMSTSQIEALNPQIKDPDLIFPGQSVNLGGGSTGSPGSSQPGAAVVGPSTTTGASNSSTSGITGGTSGTSSGGGAIGFPDKSSYSNIGSEAAKAGDITLGEKAAAQGWADSSGGATSDIAKSVFEVDNHTSTDPLKINEKK
jgi:LysM repeat protein